MGKIWKGIGKVLAFLSITLGMWLPALFTVTFFIACAATHTALGGGIMALFWCGLGFTAVSGFILSMWLRSRRKNKRADVQPAAKDKKNKQTALPPPSSAYTNGYMPPYGQNAYAPPPYGYPPYGYAPPQPQPAPQTYAPPPQPQPAPQTYAPAAQQPTPPPSAPPQREPMRPSEKEWEKKYFEQPPARYERTASFDKDVVVSYGKTGGSTKEREAESRLDADQLWRRLQGTDVPDEQPLVFRTRKDPDLYVYEYSDRYQYWRRTKNGMVFENTEYKNK